ncbi:hypothetical protein UFOVP606_22 [uncultured Caudovirales phage]|uniref:Uncharacterized protein n=1 Tax=uncultured Caudovirales phage TaxID=2100421 RepID=A0A6J5N204_9CAUD|nr:hypothetical protein UFOVP606_22 [uncultured Caudovirales phage]
MSYTNITLFGLGLLGILLHILVELNKINRSKIENIKLASYLKVEQFSIYVSIVILFITLVVKTEIAQLEQVGKWLGLSFVAIGYMGQSLLIWFVGKANKTIGKTEDEN